MAWTSYEAKLQRQKNAAYRATVEARCILAAVTPTRAVLVRGIVDEVKCRTCGTTRWDDGTRCKTCGCYQRLFEEQEGAEA